MLIVCPSCASRYEIDPEKLGSGGRKVRCRACSFQWFAHGEGNPAAGTPPSDGAVATVQESRFQAEEPQPAVMRADQNATDFVEQEWARAGESDPAVAGALVAQEPAAHDPVVQEMAGDAAPPLSEVTADATSAADAVLEMPVAAARPKPARGMRKKLSFRPAFRLPRLVPAGLSRSVFSPGTIILGGVAILALLVVQRHAVVSRVPQTAGVFRAIGLPVNLQGLEFERVATEMVEDAQGRFLIVQGEIRNIAKGTLAVPPIEIVIQDATVKSLYTWTAEASRPTIVQGDSIPFRTRLASPPQNGSNVILRFAADRKTVQN